MPRPLSIIWFERIIFGTLALGAFQVALSWNKLVAQGESMGTSASAIGIQLALTTLVIAGLTLLTSRRRSNIAKWVSVTFFVLGLPTIFWIVRSDLFTGSTIIMALQTLGQLLAYGLLFTPSARRWLNSAPTEIDLGETFS